MEINPRHSGLWYNPQQSGHGISVEVINAETLVVYWYTYHPDGTPIWLLSVADIDGDTASGLAYQYSGMRFGEFDPDTVNEEVWGSLSIEFVSCDTARLSYASNVIHDGQAYGSGTIDLIRLTAIQGLHCYDEMSSTTGYWEVTWSDLTSSETHTGAAISDGGGLVTIRFDDAHLIGTLSRTGVANEDLVLDARLDLGPFEIARKLSMVGQPTGGGFRFSSDTDEFEFTAVPDRPRVAVTQNYLDGIWDDTIEMTNGEFSWDTWFINLWIHNTLKMTIPADGGNTIPIVVTSVPWPNETFNGHAFYWRDIAAGMEYIDMRWVWDDVILFGWTMERAVPQ